MISSRAVEHGGEYVGLLQRGWLVQQDKEDGFSHNSIDICKGMGAVIFPHTVMHALHWTGYIHYFLVYLY